MSTDSTPNDGLGFLFREEGLIACEEAADGLFRAGRDGVARILATGCGKVELICRKDGRVLAYVRSAMGYPAIYPFHPVRIEKPPLAVLMDLDGTSVRSEDFWVWIIEQTTAALLGSPRFTLEEADLPYVSGHSVSEHLQHCIRKYCPEKTVEDARRHYFEITRREMAAIVEGRGRADAFHPAEGLKEFLLELKARGVKIGLVTSGLHEKAWPEIVAAFRQLAMGDPMDFYDAIVTAGFPLGQGQAGTLGELEPKPHPWLYAETARVGLGVDFSQRHRVVGIEDSGAGVVALRLAGFATIGLTGGNIGESGAGGLCSHRCATLSEILAILF